LFFKFAVYGLVISILDSDLAFISELYIFSQLWFHKTGGLKLKQQMIEKGRKELEQKLSNAFGGKIYGLSTELQEILIDDMVTAFENRLKVLINLNEKDDN
jgi:hypothetical protein